MTQYRVPRKSSQYYVPQEVYLTVVHFCRQYPIWTAELDVEPDSGSGIDYSKERVQTSNQYDATAEPAMRRAEIARKKAIVDDTAHEVANSLAKWLVMGVGNGLTYFQLRDRGIPCGKDKYYSLRQKFYYEISKKI